MSLTNADIEARVRKVLERHFGYDQGKVVPSASLEDDLGMDSLDCMEARLGIEEEFGIEFSDEEAASAKLVSDIRGLVRKQFGPDEEV